MTAPDAVVYAVVQWGNCEEDHDGNAVVTLYASKQTAEQDLDRRGGHRFGLVMRMPVRTALPPR